MILKVKDLKFKFDVRLYGNELDVVNQMVGVLKGGGKLPPIVVNQRHEIVEGRKRVAAAKAAGLPEIEVEIRDFPNSNAERMFAMEAQLGTAEPLSEEDIRWNMRQLILGGTSYEELIQRFSSRLTQSLATRYVDDAFSVLNKERIAMATAAVLNGMSKAKAMIKFGVTEKQLRDSGDRRKTNIRKSSLLDSKSQMGVAVRGLSKRIEAQGKHVLQQIKDGLVSNEDALNIVKHTIQLVDGAQNRVTEYGDRIVQAIELRKKIAANHNR